MNWKLFFVTLSRLFVLKNVEGAITNVGRESNQNFALKLSTVLGQSHVAENVVTAPLVVQGLLALLYYGSADETSAALRSAANLQEFANKQSAVRNMMALLNSIKSNVSATHSTSRRQQVYYASAIYAPERFTLNFRDDFKEQAAHLGTLTECLNFAEARRAADGINYWFLERTNFTIGEVLAAGQLHRDSQLLAVSAASFKVRWAQAFDAKQTEELNFHSDPHRFKAVESMFTKGRFNYKEFEYLDAKAIELPLEGGYLQMLIIYPNKVDGLGPLEAKLRNEDFFGLVREMREQKVALTLPRFRAVFSADLKPVLTQLDLGAIFESTAKFPNVFSSLFSAFTPRLDSLHHKALLEVDESGAAAPPSGFSFADLFQRPVQLFISHPFYFAIRNNDVVLMAGHIVDI